MQIDINSFFFLGCWSTYLVGPVFSFGANISGLPRFICDLSLFGLAHFYLPMAKSTMNNGGVYSVWRFGGLL